MALPSRRALKNWSAIARSPRIAMGHGSSGSSVSSSRRTSANWLCCAAPRARPYDPRVMLARKSLLAVSVWNKRRPDVSSTETPARATDSLTEHPVSRARTTGSDALRTSTSLSTSWQAAAGKVRRRERRQASFRPSASDNGRGTARAPDVKHERCETRLCQFGPRLPALVSASLTCVTCEGRSVCIRDASYPMIPPRR